MRYLLPLVLLCGCSLQSMYVAADRLTFEAVAPEYVDYVNGDPKLTKEQKKRRHRTVRAWDARTKEGEK